jgi:hypothetical protein
VLFFVFVRGCGEAEREGKRRGGGGRCQREEEKRRKTDRKGKKRLF